MMERIVFPSPIGMIAVEVHHDTIYRLSLHASEKLPVYPNSLFGKSVMDHILGYLHGNLQTFPFRVALEGSPFEQAVYQTLMKVPYGSTISYGDLATQSGYPKAMRAVGSAMKKNQIALIVPCHRVIQASGSLGFYGGGEALKAWLLELEQTALSKQQI